MIRDRAYDEALYAYRSAGEGIKDTPKDHNILPKDPSEVDI